MRYGLARTTLTLAAIASVISCGDSATAPRKALAPHSPHFATIPIAGSKVVISQVFGGGGNGSGATAAPFKNDFIELYNAGADSVDLSGASVQYASAGGTSWQVTPLVGKIGPGNYYLIQEAVGANTAAAPLPTPDATGSIPMSASAGKVALVSNATALTGSGCPTMPSSVIDYVGFGTGTSGANCFEGTAAAPTLSNTTAALRKNGGQQDTNDNALDFASGAPNPRNTQSTGLPPVDVLAVSISPANSSASVGATVNFTAAATKGTENVAITSATWSSTNTAVATIDPSTGVAHAISAGTTTIGVTVVTAEGNASSTTSLTVSGGTITPGTVFVSEIHYDNAGTDAGEAIEIQGPANASIDGWSLVLYDGNGGVTYNTTPLTGTIPATCSTKGVVVINYPVNGIQNGSPDGWALVDNMGKVVEFSSYEGTFTATNGPAAGLTSVAIGADESTAPPVGFSVQRAQNGVWFGPATATFGACNAATPPAPGGTISVQPRLPGLPVGFQTQMFLNNGGVDSKGNPVGNSDVTWSTSDASIVSVDATTGVITAKAVGTASITATDKNEAATNASTTITTYVAPIGDASVRVGHNTELGAPRDADPNDDIIIARRQYTLSYNASHGDPNWVSWNLDASHKGNSARCNCFTADPEVAKLGLPAYNTSDWINGGTWSRGHMSPSADWTDADGDNAPTFYLSNMLPQNQALNGGAWGDLENHLRDLAVGTVEIYIVSGGIFTKNRGGAGVDGFGFMAGTGHIAVPDSIWKIAIVVPDGRSESQITDPSQVQVIAANFPNDASGTGTWDRYTTTIDKIQKSTGYDFLNALPEPIQCVIESRNCAPTARITSSISASGWQTNEGQSVTFSASTSTDPNAGDVLSYQWSVNGQTIGIGQTASYTFSNDGTYDVALVVSDDKGASTTAHVNVTALNVAPTIATFNGATLLPGEKYTASGSFTDPGADTWTATVNYGDGSATTALTLAGKSFTLSHAYATAGSFTVTVTVSDGLATSSATATVLVKTPVQTLDDIIAMVDNLGGSTGPLNGGQVNSLEAKLQNASKQLTDPKATTPSAVNMLGAFLNELAADVQSGKLTDAQAAPISAMVQRVITSVQMSS